MVRVIVAVFLVSFLATTPVSGAEWAVGWSGTDGRFQQQTMADDKAYQFAMDRFICKASKISLDSVQNEIFERRSVACQMSEDTYVSTDLSYNMNGKTCMDTQSLTIYYKDKIYIASLFVKCK